MSSRDLIGQEYAARVDGKIEVPFRVSQFERALHGRHACIGDADVATTQVLERLVERALDQCALAHVDLDRDRAGADLLRCSLSRRGIEIGDGDFRAASRERMCNGAADAIRAARYE